MATLEQILGLDELLARANDALPGWQLSHPEAGPLTAVDQVVRATRLGTVQDRDAVLHGLARLGNVEGDDLPEAAALLCHLLVPGVVSKVMRSWLPSVNSDELNVAAAEHLWIQCRTFPWRTHRKVAASITWSVRRLALADVGLTEVSRRDRTWASTLVSEPARLERQLHAVGGPDIDRTDEPSAELAGLLAWAGQAGIVSGSDIDLLLVLVEAARRASPRRATTSGLLSAEVSQAVGDRLGIGASTVRRRVRRCLGILHAATRSEQFISGFAA